MYAEELCFAPKYVRLKKLLDDGALGQADAGQAVEKHDGPHAPHFWDVDRSGGGVTMDMGCHAIEFFRWMLGKPPITSVYAQMATQVHGDKTRGDDNALIILSSSRAAASAWPRKAGPSSAAWTTGPRSTAPRAWPTPTCCTATRSRPTAPAGYDYAVEKAGSTVGWSFTIYEEAWNYGFPQEMAHFVDCVQNDKQPLETGEDGRAVLEVILAAYESAGTGRKVALPFSTVAACPQELWKPRG